MMKHTKMIMQYFEEQVRATPAAPAVLTEEASISYTELNSRANQLARTLRDRGVGPDTIVGIMAERSIEMIIGLFGILKAGGAYLPLLPRSPAERTHFLIKESRMALLLTQTPFLKDYDIPALDLCDEVLYRGSTENLEPINRPEDLIYVIYTSGSTGKPKGVMIEHHSVVNRLLWMQAHYPLAQRDVILQKTPFIFDVSVWELFWWCMTGARLCLLKPGYEKFPQAIIECTVQKQVTVMHFVPSMLSAFLNYVDEHQDAPRLASLQQVFASGEVLTPGHLKKFNRILYDTNATRLANLYGPTEATIDVTYFDCPTQGEIERVPIGKPIDNTEILILNEDNTRAPILETGELCIAGAGVARGYLHNPALTAEKFVAHPLRAQERIYRTGDLARWLPDGNIEFLGRADQQVKVRGIRIEPGEIECAIAEFAAIRQCVVVAEQESENITLLTAYIVATDNFSVGALKEHLKRILPDYMMPNLFIAVDAIPLTPTGKADRTMLTNWRRKKG
jgi:D-alanine--poly(phosphoribitol) ligase subunit 1